jgi:hypothetical protein
MLLFLAGLSFSSFTLSHICRFAGDPPNDAYLYFTPLFPIASLGLHLDDINDKGQSVVLQVGRFLSMKRLNSEIECWRYR